MITQTSNAWFLLVGAVIISWLLYSLITDEEKAQWALGKVLINEISAESKTQEQDEVYNVSISGTRSFHTQLKSTIILKTNSVFMLGRNGFKSIHSLFYLEHLDK